MIAVKGTIFDSFKIGRSTIYSGIDDPNVTPPVGAVLKNSDIYIRDITSVSNVGPQLWIYDENAVGLKWKSIGFEGIPYGNLNKLYFEKDIPAGFNVGIGETILNYSVIKSINNGEFNFATGEFIPQITGIYSFNIVVGIESNTTISQAIGLTVNNNADFQYGYAQTSILANTTSTMSLSITLPLNALDNCKLVFRNANTITKYFGTYTILKLG